MGLELSIWHLGRGLGLGVRIWGGESGRRGEKKIENRKWETGNR